MIVLLSGNIMVFFLNELFSLSVLIRELTDPQSFPSPKYFFYDLMGILKTFANEET